MGDASTTASGAAVVSPTTTMSTTNATTSWAAGVMMNQTYVTQSQAQFNQTVTLINNLLLGKVQALRSMHVSLGAFSLGLGLLMILRIVNDARRAAALQVHLRPKRFDLFMNVHPAETFPLVLGGAIVIQQLVFVAVQSTALNSVLVSGCGGIAQVIFPAMFILGYTTLIFGIETLIRSVRSRRFRPRGKWTTPVCLVAIAALLLFTWIPTAVWRSPNRCFGSLVWFTVNFQIVAIGIICFLLFMFLLIGTVILFRLMGTYKLDHEERVSASRICYYILFSIALYAFILPFFIQAYLRNFDTGLTTSRFAEAALFSSGIFVAFIHLFLRVNASRLVIQPRGQPWQKRPRIRFFGPSDLELTISGPMMPQDTARDDLALMPEKQAFPDTNHFYTRPEKNIDDLERAQTPVDPSRWPLPPPAPGSAPDSPITPVETDALGNHKRKMSNYSLFPTRAEDIPRLPATIYSPPGSKQNSDKRGTTASEAPSITDVSEAYLLPPNAPFAKHRRDSSSGSSATVQIGLRLSVAPAAIAAGNASAVNRIIGQRNPPPPPPPPPAMMRREQSDASGESIGLPIQHFSSEQPQHEEQSRPEPPEPAVTTPISPLRPAGLPSGPKITPLNDPSKYLQDARNKVLPPTPRPSAPPQEAAPVPPQPPVQPLQRQLSGLRMNPVTPSRPAPGLGSGTMSRSPPPNGNPEPGWI